MGGTWALGPVCAWPILLLQDLKPGNLAVNEDCELKVCAWEGLGSAAGLPS